MAGEVRDISDDHQIVIEQALLNLFLTTPPQGIADVMYKVLEQGRHINKRYDRWKRAQDAPDTTG